MKFFKQLTGFLALLLMLALSSNVKSQSSVGLGIEGGLNMSNVTVTPDINSSSRTGFLVGGFVDMGVSDMVHIRSGLRYVTKGFSNTVNGNTFNDKLSYLEIPALLEVRFPVNMVKPYLTAGPTLGIRLSASEDATNGVQVQNSDVSNVYTSIDFGLYFGGGMDIHVASKTDLFIGVGYSLGLSNIANIQNVTGKNNGIQLTSGVKFSL